MIAKGTHPNECINLIKENCFIVISGNTDRHFSQDHDMKKLSEMEQKRIKWNRELLTEENRKYLQSLPFCYEFYMSGSLVRLFHATPVKDNEVVLNLDTIEKKSKMFDPSSNTRSQEMADIVIYGHIHHQYLDKLYNKTLINAGSVGNAFDVIRKSDFDSDKRETTNAHYVIVEGKYNEKNYGDAISFQFIRTSYDIEKELEDINENLEPDIYRYEIKEGMYRNMTKVEQGYKDRGVVLRK
ncbi:MAG: metallophosphoesterase family protein [Bacilli bacterium]